MLGGGGGSFTPIYARPGAIRRFGVICSDPDDDPIAPRLQSPPTRGDLTVFDPAPESHGWWGNEVWIDAAYVPRTPYEGTDTFAIAAGGPRGEGPPTPLGIVTRALPENAYGGGCGWSGGGATRPGVPLTTWARCTDPEGDPLQAEVASAPAHGQVAPPTVAPDTYGQDGISVTYTPDPGFEGSDGFSLRVGDGHGSSTRLDFTVGVHTDEWYAPPVYTIGTPFDWPELRPPPTDATWLPSVGQAAPVSPLEQARRALGTRSVKLVKTIGDAKVYALRESLKTSTRPRRALAVTCPVRCTVTSSGTVAGAGVGSAKLNIKPGKAAALTLRMTAAQRARVRRAGGARAVFRLKVVRSARKARRGTVKLALRA